MKRNAVAGISGATVSNQAPASRSGDPVSRVSRSRLHWGDWARRVIPGLMLRREGPGFRGVRSSTGAPGGTVAPPGPSLLRLEGYERVAVVRNTAYG